MTESAQSQSSRWSRVVLPLGLFATCVGVAVMLVVFRPEPQREDRGVPPLPVEITRAHHAPRLLQVSAHGRVRAAERVTLRPQVSGRVVWLHQNLRPGLRVEKGAPLVRIEEKDYRLQKTEALAQIADAQANLALEEARREVALFEWRRLGFSPESGEDASLALREPQLQAARGALEQAQAALRQAELNLERTTLRAPFDAVVQSSNVARGDLMTNTTEVAALVAIDRYWVEASFPAEQVRAVPWDQPRIEAEVIQDIGGVVSRRQGVVKELLPSLGPQDRMTRVLVEVPFPLEDEGLPLLLEAFVEVHIEGRQTRPLARLPPAAMQAGDLVYVVRPDRTLGIEDVDVVWREPNGVLVGGLPEGAAVITTYLTEPVEGMAVQPIASAPVSTAE